MNIVLCLAHSIEEYDQVRLLSGLGYDVFSLGGYIDPAHPHDPKRPALPDAPRHPELQAAVDALGVADNIGAAQARIPDAVLDWADVLIYHHYLSARLYPQWERVRHKRVIWRTVGQSVENNEREAAPYRADGLQIVRYSPKERNIPSYVGEDALIRFYKDPADYTDWTGEESVVINVTQHLRQREPYTNWGYWNEATAGLPALALGPGSEEIGGPGQLDYPDMLRWLQRARAYLYTGTQPASYTLGLIEAMMTGIPVVSIGPRWMGVFPYGPDLFEGHELASAAFNDPASANTYLWSLLNSPNFAWEQSQLIRSRAIELFGRERIGAEWKAFLG